MPLSWRRVANAPTRKRSRNVYFKANSTLLNVNQSNPKTYHIARPISHTTFEATRLPLKGIAPYTYVVYTNWVLSGNLAWPTTDIERSDRDREIRSRSRDHIEAVWATHLRQYSLKIIIPWGLNRRLQSVSFLSHLNGKISLLLYHNSWCTSIFCCPQVIPC